MMRQSIPFAALAGIIACASLRVSEPDVTFVLDAAPGRSVMEGHVFDQSTREPISGAQVHVWNHYPHGAVTDSTGFFRLELPEADSFRIRVFAITYSDVVFPVDLPEGHGIRASIPMRRAEVRIR